MNCLTCLHVLKIRVIVPEEVELQGIDQNGDPSTSPANNSFCGTCGTQVPSAWARLLAPHRANG